MADISYMAEGISELEKQVPASWPAKKHPILTLNNSADSKEAIAYTVHFRLV